MPYITSVERRGIQQGLEQGIQQGLEQGRELGLEQGRLAGLRTGLLVCLEICYHSEPDLADVMALAQSCERVEQMAAALGAVGAGVSLTVVAALLTPSVGAP